MICDTAESDGVSDMVRPTVPKAEAVSYRHRFIGAFSINAMTHAPPRLIVTPMTVSATAFMMLRGSMVRPKAVTDVRPRSALTALSASTATVTVLRPPAVEPGEPPISMSTHATACEGPVSALSSRVLKPAVRSVTL